MRANQFRDETSSDLTDNDIKRAIVALKMQLREAPLPKHDDNQTDKEATSSGKLPEMADPLVGESMESELSNEEEYQVKASQSVQCGSNDEMARSVSDIEANLSSISAPSGKTGITVVTEDSGKSHSQRNPDQRVHARGQQPAENSGLQREFNQKM